MTEPNTKPEAQAIIEALEKHLPTPQVTPVERGDVDKAKLLLVPASGGGFVFLDPRPHLDAYREFPKRREGTAHLTTLASFIDHVNRSADFQSAVFLDDESNPPRLIAVYDYHLSAHVGPADTEKKPDDARNLTVVDSHARLVGYDEGGSLARNLKHRAEYRFPLSKEWQAWSNAGSSFMEPAVFAAWLEDRLVDVLEPVAVPEKTAALAHELGIALVGKHRLMELSKGMALNVERKVVNRVNLSSGETEMVFEERHADKEGAGKLNIPGGLAISIPVLRGGDLFTVLVRFRYRVRDGKVSYNLAPHNLERVFETVIAEAEAKVAADTALPVFRGTPEGGAR